MSESDNLTNTFLLLPSLVREEIYSHLLPSRRTIWLSRNISRAHMFVDAGRTSMQALVFRKRQLELRALSHWYPGSTGIPTPEEMSAQTEGYMFGRNSDDIGHILGARLVCRQVAAEVDIVLFRDITLWWTLWDAGLPFIKTLTKLDGTPDDGTGVPYDHKSSSRTSVLTIPL